MLFSLLIVSSTRKKITGVVQVMGKFPPSLLPTATPRRTPSLFVTHTRDDFITRDVFQSTIHSTVTPNLIVLAGLINSMCFSGINPIVFALFAQVKAKAIFSLPTIGHHSNSRVLQRMSSSGKGFQTSSRFAGKFAHSFT